MPLLDDDVLTAGYGGLPGVHDENSGTAERVSAKLAAVLASVADCCGSFIASIAVSMAAVIVIVDVIAQYSMEWLAKGMNGLTDDEEDNSSRSALSQPTQLGALEIVVYRSNWLRLPSRGSAN